MNLSFNKTFRLACSLALLLAGLTARAQFIQPGKVWRDTDGKPINAHGGGMLHHGGKYFWYGEFKTGKTYLPDCNKSWGGTRVDTVGVSCYSSTNLTDWKNEGIVLSAVKNDTNSDLHVSKVLERPKVVYNAATRKFVLWMHVDSTDYAAARSGVAVSDSPTGPFQYRGSFRPNAGVWPLNATDADKIPDKTNNLARDFAGGQMARDFTVFVDDDARAYLFYSSEGNPTLHISLLTDDYLKPTDKFVRAFIHRSMEAPTVFKHGGKYYFIGSGCTAWEPNAARSAVADNIFGPWQELGNPCSGPEADKTFRSQSTYVLPLGAGRFIFMADRWKQWNLPDSRYVWLPLTISANGRPVVLWQDRWSPAAFPALPAAGR
ncbi:MAG: glycoside hydrolase family 43 protein [Verrucomicrobiota bacterium]